MNVVVKTKICIYGLMLTFVMSGEQDTLLALSPGWMFCSVVLVLKIVLPCASFPFFSGRLADNWNFHIIVVNIVLCCGYFVRVQF